MTKSIFGLRVCSPLWNIHVFFLLLKWKLELFCFSIGAICRASAADLRNFYSMQTSSTCIIKIHMCKFWKNLPIIHGLRWPMDIQLFVGSKFIFVILLHFVAWLLFRVSHKNCSSTFEVNSLKTFLFHM